MLTALLHAVLILNAFAADQTAAIRLSFDPPTLDWNLGDVPIHVVNNTVEGLYEIDSTGKLKPREAESLPRKVSSGAYRIRLKKGLKWSDGKPVTAADYVYSWTRLKDPKTASTYRYLLEDITEARALSDTEIEVRAKRLSSNVFTHWATFPMREDAGIKVFNGPYKIESYKANDKLVLVPNPMHKHPGRFSRIDALIVTDDATALRLYETGKLDFLAELGALERKRIEARRDRHVMPSPVLVYVGIDPAHPLLAQPKLRRALSLAIDRAAVAKVMGAPVTPTTSLTPNGPNPNAPRALVAPELKDQHLGFAYFEKGANRTLAELLQAQWKSTLKLGVDLYPAEVKTYWLKLSKKLLPLFLNSFSPPVWDNYYYYALLRSSNPMNMGRWSNSDFDAALERHDLKTLERIVREQTPVIPLYFRSYEYLMSPRLAGARVNPMTSLYLP